MFDCFGLIFDWCCSVLTQHEAYYLIDNGFCTAADVDNFAKMLDICIKIDGLCIKIVELCNKNDDINANVQAFGAASCTTNGFSAP